MSDRIKENKDFMIFAIKGNILILENELAFGCKCRGILVEKDEDLCKNLFLWKFSINLIRGRGIRFYSQAF